MSTPIARMIRGLVDRREILLDHYKKCKGPNYDSEQVAIEIDTFDAQNSNTLLWLMASRLTELDRKDAP